MDRAHLIERFAERMRFKSAPDQDGESGSRGDRTQKAPANHGIIVPDIEIGHNAVMNDAAFFRQLRIPEQLNRKLCERFVDAAVGAEFILLCLGLVSDIAAGDQFALSAVTEKPLLAESRIIRTAGR